MHIQIDTGIGERYMKRFYYGFFIFSVILCNYGTAQELSQIQIVGKPEKSESNIVAVRDVNGSHSLRQRYSGGNSSIISLYVVLN